MNKEQLTYFAMLFIPYFDYTVLCMASMMKLSSLTYMYVLYIDINYVEKYTDEYGVIKYGSHHPANITQPRI